MQIVYFKYQEKLLIMQTFLNIYLLIYLFFGQFLNKGGFIFPQTVTFVHTVKIGYEVTFYILQINIKNRQTDVQIVNVKQI